MLFVRNTRAPGGLVFGALMVVSVAALAWAAPAVNPKPGKSSAAPAPAALPVVQDTKTNLGEAFDYETNAKERYKTIAKLADRDGFVYLASLFRACARAEEVHAEQHVHAIAWVGGEARALLQRPILGTTPENLKASIELEDYEVNQLYPAMLAQARLENQPEAVRSITYALGAERDHLQLLTAALATLDDPPLAHAFFVCPQCGHTVEAVSTPKCPHCFAGAGTFLRVE